MAKSASAQNASQKLPQAGPAREALRESGQFWTPEWLARVMTGWVTALSPERLFDPAVGPGTFFTAARASGFRGECHGFELDPSALDQCGRAGLSRSDIARVTIGDFIQAPVRAAYPAIVSNPPYIRHHRLGDSRKAGLKAYAKQVLGFTLDGRTGLQAYFLVKCLTLLSDGGRLAFLLPADVCEGVSARKIWEWIAARFRIEAVLTFSETAAPFPQVDTNAMVFFLSRNTPSQSFLWCRVERPDAAAISRTLVSPFQYGADEGGVRVVQRDVSEAVATGLSRPLPPPVQNGFPLSRFARVMRGIATGGNEFFFFTSEQIRAAGFPARFLRRAIGRTRDCSGTILAAEDLDALDASGRPTWLLNLNRQPVDALPSSIRSHLAEGVKRGIHQRALIQTRRPWYRMEQRDPPPRLFAYLGRRDCRFVLNRAGVVPLTAFLCVYPHDPGARATRRLWRALNDPRTLQNLVFVAKSYGSGALKVEPRQLEQLKIPFEVAEEHGLTPAETAEQLVLLEEPYTAPASRRKKRPGHG